MELREMNGFSVVDLKKKVEDLKKDLFDLKLQNVAGSLENTAKIKEMRRTIARAMTVLTQKVRK